MEKVILKTCVKKETAKGVFYTIELLDGRKGISSDDFTQKMGMEIEIEVKEGKEYQGEKQYYFNLPKENKSGQSGKFPQKDWSYEKRRASLDSAIAWVSTNRGEEKITTDTMLGYAEKFFNYLNQK